MAKTPVTKTAKVTPIGTAVAKAKVNLPSDVNAAMAAEVAAIQNRISAPTGDRIQATQGKTFKFPNGQEVDSFECVIVDFAASNMYYETAFDRNNVTPPACFAIGLEPATLVPSDNSPEKQSAGCSSCWANQFGSSGKGKACSNTRLLAVLPLDADSETELMILKVSPTGLRAFDGLVGTVARQMNLPIRGVVTEISFSPDQEYASMRFRAIGPTSKDLLMLAQSRKEEAMQRLLTEPDVSAVAAPASKKGGKPATKKPAVAGRR
jgi:hypothetical protein